MDSILYWTVVLSAFDLFNAYQPAASVNSLQSHDSRPSRRYGHSSVNGKESYEMNATPNIHGSISPDEVQVYGPKEDPRLFYLSDLYLNGPNPVSHEVAAVYPGIRANIGSQPQPYTMNRGDFKQRESQRICVRCPHDRTLRVRPGSRGVLLRRPRLHSCSGLHVRRNIHFLHLSGPRFGSLLSEGDYVVNGRIVFDNTTLQHCQMQVRVSVGGCATPQHLVARCDEEGLCSFSCRDTRLRLRGQTQLQCHSGGGVWSDDLPTCHARSWCKLPQPPDHGHLSCQANGLSRTKRSVLAEGSRCRARCKRGWRPARPYSVVCRRGYWTKQLACVPKGRHVIV